MKILFTESSFNTKKDLNLDSELEDTIKEAYRETRILLSSISDKVNFVVQANSNECVRETGGGGFTRNSELIIAFYDPTLPHGRDTLMSYIRSMIFHELNHAARYNSVGWSSDFLEGVVSEGLATVFERDYAKAQPLWGQYNSEEAKNWFNEIKSLENNAGWSHYMFEHPDGRKWIGYKTGTYIVDLALKNSDKSLIELTAMKYQEIIHLAKIE